MTKKSSTELSVYETLSKVNVNEFTEKKNGLTYLSWANAWAKLKEHYPNSCFEKIIEDNGMPYIQDAQGFAYVRVRVSVVTKDRIEKVMELFPVTDYRNKPIKNPNSFDVNTAHQRCLTKAIGYLGLGLYIYAGEDLPPDSPLESQSEPVEKETPQEIGRVKDKQQIEKEIEEWERKKAIEEAYKPTPSVTANDGEKRKTNGWDMVAAVFTEMMILYNSQQALVKFYKGNKKVLDQLEQEAPSLYEEVIQAFAKRKEEVREGK